VQGKRAAGPVSNSDRRSLQRQLRPGSTALATTGRGADSTASRSRQPQPVRISFDEAKGGSIFGIGTSVMSWVVVLGGILLAVVGVVNASLPLSGEQNEQPSVAEDVLNKQIAQLKAELDKERAEKTELIDQIAVVKASPPPQPAAPAVQTVVQTTTAQLQSDAEDDPSLPQPMAPSVELMLSDIPVSSVPVSSEAAGANPPVYGIHLASFADRTMAERGWLLLQRNHSAALGELKPRVDETKDEHGNPVFVLIAGPFDTETAAAAHCKKISAQVVFCKPRPYNGSEVAAAVQQ
jgi:SPOR domain